MKRQNISESLLLPAIKNLFWWVPESEISSLSDEAIVEAVLNNGNETMVKQLLDFYGIDYVAETFNRQISGRRNNYRPRTVNFFQKYFQRHTQN
ncbi:MAG: hypothetical protein PHU03_07020 [Syntrophales bacterium]|nr:hypothetical protein [Syntrophales bacterium]